MIVKTMIIKVLNLLKCENIINFGTVEVIRENGVQGCDVQGNAGGSDSVGTAGVRAYARVGARGI